MEFGSRPRPGNDQKKDHLGHHVQGLHGPRLEGGAAVFDQKRHDRPSGHAQRIGAQETQKQTMSALRIRNCRLREKQHGKGKTFTAGNDDWSFHAHARGIHPPASGTRGNLRRGCAHGAGFPAQSAVQQGFLAPIAKESRFGICSHAGTRRPASCEARFAQRGLAKCLLSRLCRLHANARVCAEPGRIDPPGEPGPNRLDVR